MAGLGTKFAQLVAKKPAVALTGYVAALTATAVAASLHAKKNPESYQEYLKATNNQKIPTEEKQR